eukprot:452165-Rhodomonas_salina.1
MRSGFESEDALGVGVWRMTREEILRAFREVERGLLNVGVEVFIQLGGAARSAVLGPRITQ